MTDAQFERLVEAINNLIEVVRQSRYPIYVRDPYIAPMPYPAQPPYVPPFISPTVPPPGTVPYQPIWQSPNSTGGITSKDSGFTTCENKPWLSPTVVGKGDFASGFSTAVAQADGDSVGGLNAQWTPTDEVSRCVR